jgi:hypothetical protein
LNFFGNKAPIPLGLLLMFSVVAMFIGLFINLIFEDKAIANSE